MVRNVVEVLAALDKAMPQWRMVAEGDYASFRWVATMTHVGDHLGFPASGKTATLAGSGFIKGDGTQILDAWNYMDLHQLFQKLQSF